jgi:hypothetical protein
MARLLTILFIGLLCEAIGVVLLSKGLKEIFWFLSARDIRDAASLASKLSAHPDPVSAYFWEKLTPQEQVEVAGSTTSGAQKRRVLARILNQFLPDESLFEKTRFAEVQLSPETRTALAQNREGNELLHRNRLVLQDAYPAELARAQPAVSASQILGLVSRGVTNHHILLGVFFEALFFVGLLMLMSKADVSFVWPLTSLSFVVTTVAAKLYLHEHVSALRWSGVCLIMMGAALITWTEKQSHPPVARTPPMQSPVPDASQ